VGYTPNQNYKGLYTQLTKRKGGLYAQQTNKLRKMVDHTSTLTIWFSAGRIQPHFPTVGRRWNQAERAGPSRRGCC